MSSVLGHACAVPPLAAGCGHPPAGIRMSGRTALQPKSLMASRKRPSKGVARPHLARGDVMAARRLQAPACCYERRCARGVDTSPDPAARMWGCLGRRCAVGRPHTAAPMQFAHLLARGEVTGRRTQTQMDAAKNTGSTQAEAPVLPCRRPAQCICSAAGSSLRGTSRSTSCRLLPCASSTVILQGAADGARDASSLRWVFASAPDVRRGRMPCVLPQQRQARAGWQAVWNSAVARQGTAASGRRKAAD